MASGLFSSKTAVQPLEKKERMKLLPEVLVHIIQASLVEGPVSRLIGGAAAPDAQPERCSTPPAAAENVKTMVTSVWISCDDVSTKTAAPFCCGFQGRASWGT